MSIEYERIYPYKYTDTDTWHTIYRHRHAHDTRLAVLVHVENMRACTCTTYITYITCMH